MPKEQPMSRVRRASMVYNIYLCLARAGKHIEHCTLHSHAPTRTYSQWAASYSPHFFKRCELLAKAMLSTSRRATNFPLPVHLPRLSSHNSFTFPECRTSHLLLYLGGGSLPSMVSLESPSRIGLCRVAPW